LVSSKKVNSISYENSILKIKFDDLEYEGVYRSDNVIVGSLIKSVESFPMELSFSYFELYENGMQKKWFDEQPISISEGSSKFGNSQKMISVQKKTYSSKSKTYPGNNLLNYIVSEKMSGTYTTFHNIYPDINTTDTIGKFVNGKREGKWIKKYPSGSNLNSEFIYENDKLIKEIGYIDFSENNKFSESYFTNGIKTNTIFYDRIGGKIGEEVFEGDYSKKYNYKNGVITDSYRVSKISGTYEGDYIGYYENGKIRTKEYYEKDRIMHFTRYFENGNINEYYDAKKREKFNSKGEKIFYIDLTSKKGFILYEKGDKWDGIIDDYSEKPNGYGTYYYINGEKFIGNYNYKDDFYGKGQYFWADGRMYEGDFNNGQINGYGKMTHPDGSIKEGIWENGNLINDYNKAPIASNSKAKTVVDKKTSKKSKKGSLPEGFYSWSTKEQAEWYNTDEGTAWLMQSQVMKDVGDYVNKKQDKCFWCKKKITGKGFNYEVRNGACWISDIYINTGGFEVFCCKDHAYKYCESKN
jgi:hypothetical protein